MRGLRLKTGFTATEIFRKYLWYLLRERKFDEDAVADLSALRSVLAMKDEDVRCALPSSQCQACLFLAAKPSHTYLNILRELPLLLLIRWTSQKSQRGRRESQ